MHETGADPAKGGNAHPDDRARMAELTTRFRHNARTSLPRAPLNAALSTGIASRPELVALLAEAPTEQQTPVLMLAGLHDLVLREPGCELARWYRTTSETPRSPNDRRLVRVLRDFVADHRSELVALLRARRTQTNEVGRCALYLLAMSGLDDEVGPLALLDVGSSGGLNLQIDAYQYDFDPGGVVGDSSTVVLQTGLRGPAPVPDRVPDIAARCGIDIAPVDVTDPAAARWLEACCWPDQIDRFRRLHAAIEIARAQPPELLAGDAVASIALAIERMGHRGHPVVINSWVLNYLSADQRITYVDELDRVGATRDLTWIFVESPHQTPGLPWPDGLDEPGQTHLMRISWRDREQAVEHLARVHPHGYWAHWRG